jgi:hypothetical protein
MTLTNLQIFKKLTAIANYVHDRKSPSFKSRLRSQIMHAIAKTLTFKKLTAIAKILVLKTSCDHKNSSFKSRLRSLFQKHIRDRKNLNFQEST